MLMSRLGVSAVSRRVVNTALDYAENERIPIMITASRNQVEDNAIGTGYTSFTPQELVGYVRSVAPGYGLVCRDHGGPYFSDDDAGLPPAAAAERATASLRDDVAAGFDLVHVDWSRSRTDVLSETVRLVAELRSMGRSSLEFEVGTDETDGGVDEVKDFEATLTAIADMAGCVKFVVGRTGSLIKERFQIGYFDFETVRRLTSLAHGYGFLFKEHNADYLPAADIALRPAAGVDAINIGPELGVIETTAIARLAMTNGADDELRAFFNRAVECGKWRKWIYGADPPARMKAVIAGHYCQQSPEYQELMAVLEARVDVENIVRSELRARIDCYARSLAVTAPGGSK